MDPHTLYFAANTLWKTRDGGSNWKQISPDLTRKTWEIPANVGKYRNSDSAKPTQRGVIYAVAPSPLDIHRIWAGTDDGLIHVTSDGGAHWKDVTPPQLVPWAKVSIMDAGHFDSGTAYAGINTLRLDDMRPHILRTHDGGKTWTEIVNGLPDGSPVDVVREDPKRKGLLFAGTEREVYVSFDDGDHWQSLRLNMPATSIRDLIIKDDDLAVGTHGRGFWILDDITPLRQISATVATSAAFLFQPQTATRVRWDMNTDTPIPPDEPAGKNPPDGAIIDYYLDSPGPVTLEVRDRAGKLIRRYSSDDAAEPVDPMLAIPKYWVRPGRALSGAPGMHRWLWDLHYPPAPGSREEYPMQAVYQDTPPADSSPWVMPGRYTVKLTAAGQSYSQPLTVRMDPRVHTPTPALLLQFTLSKQVYDDVLASSAAMEQIRAFRKTGVSAALDREAATIEGERAGRGSRGGPIGPDTLTSVNGSLRQLLTRLQEADVAPTAAEVVAVADQRTAFAKLMRRWNALNARNRQ